MRALSISAVVLCAGLAVTYLGGCGGGNNSPTISPPVNAQVTVDWAARSRSVHSPSSALSVTFTIVEAGVTGRDVVFTVGRGPNTAAQTVTYSSPVTVVVGTWDLKAVFYAQANGQGSVVGTAAAPVTIPPNGKVALEIATTGVVASAAVVPNQGYYIGQSDDLQFSAADARGHLLALTQGSAFFTVTSGSSSLGLTTDGKATGLAGGTSMVTVTVDGKASPAVPVTVFNQPMPNVIVEPPSATVFPQVPVQFAAAVQHQAINGGTLTWYGTDQNGLFPGGYVGTYGVSAVYRINAPGHGAVGGGGTVNVINPEP